MLTTLKLVLIIMFLSRFASGIVNSFPDRITRMSFYQKYYQLSLQGKFPIKEKRCQLKIPFQGILTYTDLLLSSEKVTAIICSGILFTKNLYHIEASQLIYIANQLSGFQILGDFTERYFGKDLVTQ